MDGNFRDNDLDKVVSADKAHVWHHLIQHKPFEGEGEPRIIIEGKDMRVWDQNGKEYPRRGFGRRLDRQCWLWPRNASADAVQGLS